MTTPEALEVIRGLLHTEEEELAYKIIKANINYLINRFGDTMRSDENGENINWGYYYDHCQHLPGE